MTDSNQEHHYTENVQEHLEQVEALLHKHALLEDVIHRQELPRDDRHVLLDTIVHKQHNAELQRKLAGMHPADVAYILESLPIEERLLVWDLVKSEHDGEILIEVSDAVRDSLIASMSRDELRVATEQLDIDEIADLAPDLPHHVIRDVFKSLPIGEREQLRAAMSYDEDSVGALMDFNMVHVREDVTLEVVSRYLRRFDELPDHTDQVSWLTATIASRVCCRSILSSSTSRRRLSAT